MRNSLTFERRKEQMESKISTIRAYDKKCIGCQKFGAAVMISFQTKQGGDITDLFLDETQAELFHGELTRCITRNTEEDEPDH
jgi:hypothetical protein